MKKEGKAELVVGDAFYNPRMEMNRDVTVAVLNALSSDGTYLDAMSATGVRGVRALLETSLDVVLNDRSPDAVEVIRENLERNGVDAEVSWADANALMHERRFSVVDVDPFGSPAPFTQAAFTGATDLACFTATDTAPLCGAHDSGVRRYGCVPLNTEYHSEMGLRVLLGFLVREAARLDVAATPILSHASDHYARTYLLLEEGAKAADAMLEGLGYVSHCWDCMYRSASEGLIFDGERVCPYCGSSLAVAGPLWLDPVCNTEFVLDVGSELEEYMGSYDRARKLLDRVRNELSTPTHYDHHDLTGAWNVTPGKLDGFLEDLRDAGYGASRTHYSGTSFKTTADVREIREVALD